jgi:hypothetical protein
VIAVLPLEKCGPGIADFHLQERQFESTDVRLSQCCCGESTA